MSGFRYRILAIIEPGAHDTGVKTVVEATAADTALTETGTGAKAAEGASQNPENAQETQAAHTTESTGHAEGESTQGIAALGLDPLAILAQAATFLVLFFVVKKYAMEGIVKNLDNRHKDINRGLHLTAEMDKQKAQLDEQVEKALMAARKDADAIIAEAHTESGSIVRFAEESASRKAEEILRAAEGKIERDIAEARRGLRAEMAGLVSEATEAVLGQKLDAGSDRKLVEDYLSEAMK